MDNIKLEEGIEVVLNQLNPDWENILNSSTSQEEFRTNLNILNTRKKIKTALEDGYSAECNFTEYGIIFFLYHQARSRFKNETVSQKVLSIVFAFSEEELFRKVFLLKKENIVETNTSNLEAGQQLTFEF